MNFIRLAAHHFSQLSDVDGINDLNDYVDVLVLLDDLLCKYDSVPRHPEYLPRDANFEGIGTLDLLENPIKTRVNKIKAECLKENLARNVGLALELYESRNTKQAEIHEFLAELMQQYALIIHPAVHPAIIAAR